MEKSTFTDAYAALTKRLVSLRKAAGLTQRDLARKLGREPNFVARVELRERRLDLLEFFWFVRACGADPEALAAEAMRTFKSQEMARPKSRRLSKPR